MTTTTPTAATIVATTPATTMNDDDDDDDTDAGDDAGDMRNPNPLPESGFECGFLIRVPCSGYGPCART